MTTYGFDTQLAAGTCRPAIFLRVDLASPVRLWFGVGDIKTDIDATDISATYTGLGDIMALPAFSQVLNATADRIEFTVSGVSTRVASMFSAQSDNIKGKYLRLGLGMFDQSWALSGTPVWLRTVVMDYLTIEGEAQTRAVKISTRTIFSGRRRPRTAFFTDAEQQAISSGDRFCENAQRYTMVESKIWPRF